MGWPAHDPEGWDQVCISAIQDKLDEHRTLQRPDQDAERLILEDLARTNDAKDIFHLLIMASLDKLGDAESDYLTARYGPRGDETWPKGGAQ